MSASKRLPWSAGFKRDPKFGHQWLSKLSSVFLVGLRGCSHLIVSGMQPLLYLLAAALGRLAPYLERPCRRSLTPAVSKVPRIM